MRVLITSGGTTEYIDEVRVLTNISTGALGAKIARQIVQCYHDIDFVCTRTSAIPAIAACDEHGALNYKQVTDVASLMEVMKELVPMVDVVIHTMAVSDFGFKKDGVKLKSNDPDGFIEYMRRNIQVNPKVISHIKQWNPKCKLVGFKFEVGKTKDELVSIAYESLQKNNCDIVIANDKAEMQRENKHIAYAITPQKEVVKLAGKEEIALYLSDYVERLTWSEKA